MGQCASDVKERNNEVAGNNEVRSCIAPEPPISLDSGSDESSVASDFESSDDSSCMGSKSRHHHRQPSITKPTVTHKRGYVVSEDIFVDNVVKKSGCETFVISFDQDVPKKVTRPLPKPRPKTSKVYSSRKTTVAAGATTTSTEVEDKANSSKRLRSAFAGGRRPKKQVKGKICST